MSKQGDLDEAIKAQIEAKALDEGDRFLNAQLAKHMLKNGAIEDAHEIMKRWSINDHNEVSSFDMENTWYSLLTARSHYERNELIDAFRYLNIIERSTVAQYDDSYEFHLYTIRRGNFRTFTEQDKLKTSLYSPKVIKSSVMLLNLLQTIQNTVSDPELKENLMKQIAELEGRNKPFERLEDDDEIHDVTLRYSDPLHVTAFKALIQGNITQYAYERAVKALNYAPKDKDLNLIALYWFL